LQGLQLVAVEAGEPDPHEEPPGLLVAVLLARDDGAVMLNEEAGDGVHDTGAVLARQGEDELRVA
jgi:hypothetical protein